MARLIIVDDNQELATLIASSARSRGHVSRTVYTAKSALAALATGTFDLAIVDLLLPDVRGTEVLDELKSLGVPAIAISGVYRGDRFAKEAVEVHGARSFFEKPFELAALLDSVEKVTGTAPAEFAVPAEQAPDALAELSELEPVEEPPPVDEPAAGAPPPAAAPAASADLLPLADWERIWSRDRQGRPPPRRSVPTWARAGRITQGSVPRLLGAYYQAKHEGELRLKRGPVVKVVYFEKGRPVYAASNVAQERFARFCGRRGLLPESELAAVSALAKEEGVRTGDAMVRLDLITEAQRKTLLEEQVKEIIWSTFAWDEGDYSFSPTRPGRDDLVRLSVFPGDLIFEGAQHLETLASARRKMPLARRLCPTADHPYGVHEFKLSGPQAALLAHADGTKTVEDLLTLTDLSERDALAALVGFELLGLIEERREDSGRRRISFGF